jgi:4-amino-4-deoxy-L-arabinose transferase-like glycosyltransferase
MSQNSDNDEGANLPTLADPDTPSMSGDRFAPAPSGGGISADDTAAATEPVRSVLEAPLANIVAPSNFVPDILHSLDTMLKNIDGRLSQLEAQLQASAPAPRTIQPRLPIAARLSTIQLQWLHLLALATAMTVIFLRLVQLDQLQAELYGDMALIYEYIVEIRAGIWPTHFTLSVGPLYHYAIMPVIALTGPTYFGFKLASVLISLGVLGASYAFSRRLIDDRFAMLAVFIAGVSSWLLIFSRLGSSQILVPLITICALWLVVRIAQSGRTADIVACAVVSALGLYLYPQSFILPAVIGLTLVCLRWTGLQVRWADILRFLLVTILCAVPFAWIVSRDPFNFFSGYIGGKLERTSSLAEVLFGNIARAVLALHVRGDDTFRSNPAGLPHLDWISGALFLGGIVFWLRYERRRWSPVLLVPLLLLQVPSMLVLSQPEEVPSAGRTLGVAPIVYILVASGLWWLLRSIRAAPLPRLLGPTVAGVLLGAIMLLNAQRYFQAYIGGLPYQNTPVGRIIATYLDSLPPDTQIYLVGCCWEHDMPEPKSIQYVMARPDQLHFVERDSLTCDWLQLTAPPAVMIWSFHDAIPAPQIESCKAWLPAQLYTSARGLPVFYAAPLRHDLAAGPSSAALDTPADGSLQSSLAQMDGTTVKLFYSPLDIGDVGNLFDNNVDSLIRGREANPLVLDLRFPRLRAVSAVGLTLATMPHAQIKVELTQEDGVVTSFVRDYQDLSGIPDVDLPIPAGPLQTQRLRIEIMDLAPRPGDGPHIHVRELRVR